MLAQRAAVVIVEDTPIELVNVLHNLGQKLWPVARRDLETSEDRQRLLRELTSLREDRLEEIALRASAARNWLRDRLLVQADGPEEATAEDTSASSTTMSNTARHLLQQYRTHWTSGVRSLTETHFQGRSERAMRHGCLLDPRRPVPASETFLNAMALPTLATRLDEFVIDRMADFVAGLTGLAAKIELRTCPLARPMPNGSPGRSFPASTNCSARTTSLPSKAASRAA